jgi:hypothetical protein
MHTRASIDREPPSATERVARFRLYFRQIPLAELEAAGFVVVDRDEWEVTEGRRFDEKWDGIAGDQHSPRPGRRTARSQTRRGRRN